jgi:hypothetical protein
MPGGVTEFLEMTLARVLPEGSGRERPHDQAARHRFVRRRRRFRANYSPREFFTGGALRCRTICPG